MPRLQDLATADRAAFVAALDGVYEHSPWVAEAAWARRPAAGWPGPAALAQALAGAVREAGRERQLALLRAHPELAGRAAVARPLTA
ncbi:MAG: allantoate amidohydrolase, partial [Burkholderiales bacterium]|nr:allantoate amidohydrolase [Burkholderiales bacterium]